VHDILLSIVLGIVEGVTEFLPVSSTAHLRICEKLMHLDLGSPYWKMYTIVIQLGAILALPVYFWNRITNFIRTFPKGENGDRTALNHPLTLTLVAFVVTAGPSVLLTSVIGKNLASLLVMGLSLLVGGIVMWIVDYMFVAGPVDHVEKMGLGQSIWIGACQILSAVFPGTSRSMSTIAAGQIAGLTRTAALEFSFLVSITTMMAATGYELFRTIHPGKKPAQEAIAPVHIDSHQWALVGIGTVVSFIVALAVVAWFMSWVRRRGFAPFAVYRIVLGLLVLICLI